MGPIRHAPNLVECGIHAAVCLRSRTGAEDEGIRRHFWALYNLLRTVTVPLRPPFVSRNMIQICALQGQHAVTRSPLHTHITGYIFFVSDPNGVLGKLRATNQKGTRVVL